MLSRFEMAIELLGISAIVSASVLVAAMIGIDLVWHLETVTVSVDGICCQQMAETAVANIEKLPGVRSVTPDLCARRLFVTVRDPGQFPVSEFRTTLRNCKLSPKLIVWRDQTIDLTRGE
jgi:hypothetical protein